MADPPALSAFQTLMHDATLRVLLLDLDADDGTLQECYALLSRDERERAERRVTESDRRRRVMLRAFLRTRLAGLLEANAASIEFRYDVGGKPALGGEHTGSTLRFNASRSAGLGLVAIALGREVGVDIELVRPLPDPEALARQVLCEPELAERAALEPERRTEAFYLGWTRKEAILKGLGSGLSTPLQGLEVSVDPHAPAEVRRVGRRHGADSGWRLQDLSRLPEFAAAVAISAS